MSKQRAGRRWVVNASPFIMLAKVGLLDLLPRLCFRFVLPAAVATELRAGSRNDPAVVGLRALRAGTVVPVPRVHPAVAAWDLGRGESHVLTFAHANPGFEAIVDDLAARRCAGALGVPFRGVLGVLLLAKQDGLLLAVNPVLQQFRAAGFRVSASVAGTLLHLAGEGPEPRL